ncbi:MAG: SCO family protein [Chloroflexota bacterium]|nr:SCO family protein [Chloroflexota bacterium]
MRGKQKAVRNWILLVSLITLLQANSVWAHDPSLHPAQIMDALGFDQRLDAQVPLALTFQDETGKAVKLNDYFADKPVILALGYFECTTLCPLVRGGLLETLQAINFDVGDEFAVLLVSINPAETPALAATVKQRHVDTYNRLGSNDGWHFLTGDHANIDRLAAAVGFRYAYDTQKQEYAHASGIVVLTPTGRVSRYFYGLEYAPRDVRLGLVEAAANKIGNVVDQILLFCYHYNPITGQYNALVMNIVRLAGAATVLVIAGFLLIMFRKELGSRPLAG